MLNEEFIKEQGLSSDQVKAVGGLFTEQAAMFEGKANENAEGILSGAIKYANDRAGTTIERESGEKFGDVLGRIHAQAFETRNGALAEQEKALLEKAKNFKGNESLQIEYDALQGTVDGFKSKAAQFDEWSEAGYKEKSESASSELLGLKRGLAFTAAMPNFPDTINEYEKEAKWGQFKKEIIEKYDISEDGTLTDKVNEHKKTTLADVVAKSDVLNGMLQGKVNKGLATGTINTKIEGVPFEIEKGESNAITSKKIKDYLIGEKGISFTSSAYGSEFTKIKRLIAEKNQ